jgi:hypothetical protein
MLLLLAGLQLLGAIVLGVICYLQVHYARVLGEQNAKLVKFTTDRQFITSLVNDCIEYSKKNPAMDPILASVGVKTAHSVPATAPSGSGAKPAGKPGPR